MSEIYSFEPLDDCFHQMQLAFARDRRWHGYQCGLANKEGLVPFHRSASSPSSSILAMADLHRETFPQSAVDNIETIAVHRLDDVLSGVELAPKILLKLDVQGFEDRVLDGAPRILEEATVVITEVSFEALYHGQASFDDIYRRLHHAGLAFHGTSAQLVHPIDGRILQADAVFLRHDAQ